MSVQKARTLARLELLIAIGNRSNAGAALAGFLVDVAIGGAGSEQIIIPNRPLVSSALNGEFTPHVLGPFPVTIPTGSRIAVRGQSTTNDASDRCFDVVVYGVG